MNKFYLTWKFHQQKDTVPYAAAIYYIYTLSK